MQRCIIPQVRNERKDICFFTSLEFVISIHSSTTYGKIYLLSQCDGC